MSFFLSCVYSVISKLEQADECPMQLTAIVRKRMGVRWVLISCERLSKENMR